MADKEYKQYALGNQRGYFLFAHARTGALYDSKMEYEFYDNFMVQTDTAFKVTAKLRIKGLAIPFRFMIDVHNQDGCADALTKGIKKTIVENNVNVPPKWYEVGEVEYTYEYKHIVEWNEYMTYERERFAYLERPYVVHMYNYRDIYGEETLTNNPAGEIKAVINGEDYVLSNRIGEGIGFPFGKFPQYDTMHGTRYPNSFPKATMEHIEPRVGQNVIRAYGNITDNPLDSMIMCAKLIDENEPFAYETPWLPLDGRIFDVQGNEYCPDTYPDKNRNYVDFVSAWSGTPEYPLRLLVAPCWLDLSGEADHPHYETYLQEYELTDDTKMFIDVGYEYKNPTLGASDVATVTVNIHPYEDPIQFRWTIDEQEPFITGEPTIDIDVDKDSTVMVAVECNYSDIGLYSQPYYVCIDGLESPTEIYVKSENGWESGLSTVKKDKYKSCKIYVKTEEGWKTS